PPATAKLGADTSPTASARERVRTSNLFMSVLCVRRRGRSVRLDFGVVKATRATCREHMICPLPRASEMSAFRAERHRDIGNQGGTDALARDRRGAGDEATGSHLARLEWCPELVAGGRYPRHRSPEPAPLARPL